MTPLIELKDVHYSYADGTPALKGVNFTLHEGETVILLGANGSGKTTFLLHLNGLLRGGSGQISICGELLTTQNLAETRRRIGMVFQDPDEQLFMPSVIEDVSFAPLNQGVAPEAAATLAALCLEQVGLAGLAERAPYHLSSGEKRRVAIAGILAMKPAVLVLDEPTTYLDPPGQNNLIDLLARLPQPKIIATHDLDLARAIGTRAVFFSHGAIAGEGSVEDVIHRFEWQPRTRRN